MKEIIITQEYIDEISERNQTISGTNQNESIHELTSNYSSIDFFE